MQVTIKDVKEYAGGTFEPGWRLNCQLVTDTNGNEYINTPHISGDVFEVGKTYNVGLGNTFGRKHNKSFKTININE